MSDRLTKVVNGKRVELSDAEEAEVRAEWANPVVVPEPPVTAQRLAALLVAKGVITEAELKQNGKR